MKRPKILIILIILISLISSGCAGIGLNKRITLMPDSIGLETDLDPNNSFKSKLMEVRATWQLK